MPNFGKMSLLTRCDKQLPFSLYSPSELKASGMVAADSKRTVSVLLAL